MNFLNNDFGYNFSKNSNQYINDYSSNILQSSFEKRNLVNNNLSNYELRKLIREEIESQVSPYKKEIYILKGEINKLYNNWNKDSIENLIKDIKLNLNNFVDKTYFKQKIEEIESEINLNGNNYNQKLINNIINEIKMMKIEINNIKINNNLLYNKNISLPEFKSEKEPIDNINNVNNIKLKDIMDKSSFLKKDIENLKEEMNSYKEFSNSLIILQFNIFNNNNYIFC